MISLPTTIDKHCEAFGRLSRFSPDFQPAAHLCLWGFLAIEARVRCAECQFNKSEFMEVDCEIRWIWIIC